MKYEKLNNHIYYLFDDLKEKNLKLIEIISENKLDKITYQGSLDEDDLTNIEINYKNSTLYNITMNNKELKNKVYNLIKNWKYIIIMYDTKKDYKFKEVNIEYLRKNNII